MTAQNSLLHRRTLEILKSTPPFVNTRILEELSVADLFPEYLNNRDRYDIVLPDYKCIIECMGIQHSKLSTFGMEADKALQEFNSLKIRDAKKKSIALDNNWTYIEIPYTDEKRIDSDYLLSLFSKNFTEGYIPKESTKRKITPSEAEVRLRYNGYRREQSKRRYRQLKELRKRNDSISSRYK